MSFDTSSDHIRQLTPNEFANYQQSMHQGRPDVWARNLATIVNYGQISLSEAQPYAAAMAATAGENAEVFWSNFNDLIKPSEPSQ